MQGPYFLIFATDELGWSYYVDSNGFVQKQYTPVPTTTEPYNFSEMQLKWGRSNTYAGLQQTFSTPSDFIEDTAKIIRHVVYTKGSEGIITIRIYKTNLQFGGGLKRELFYESEFDLSNYTRTEEKVTTMLKEGDPEKSYRAFEDTDFEIDVSNDPEAIDVALDGLIFKNTFNYTFPFIDLQSSVDSFIPVVYVNREGITGPNVLSSNETYFPLNTEPELEIAANNWFFKLIPATGFSFRVKGSFKIKNTNTINRRFHFKFKDYSGIVHYTYGTVVVDDKNFAPGEHEIPFDFTVNIPLLIVADLGFYFILDGGQHGSFEILESSFQILFDYRYKYSIIKALPAKVLFTRILTKIFGYAPTVNSTLLTEGTDICYTCGDAIRSLPNAVIKTSAKKFFSFNHMHYCAGFDLLKDANNKAVAVLEKRKDFYKNELILATDEPADFQDSIAKDLLFNEIKIGYPNQDYGEVNGRGEFNVTNVYTTPLKRTDKKLDLTTTYRADMLGIEITRINLQNKITTDSNSDNDTFVLFIQKTPVTDPYPHTGPYYLLDRSVNPSATGLLEPTSAFNLPLSPATSLRNHGWYLRSVLWYEQDKKINFQTNDKSAELSYVNNGVTITEKADVEIASLEAPLFKPHELKISTRVPDNLAAVLTPKPKGYIQFPSKGMNWKGFILEASIKPVTEEEQDWRLLASVDNDMTKLI